LSSAGAFSTYTWTAGDTIYLMNAVGGVADGLYEIASKVDSDAILLVANAGLTADSTADADSSSGAFATTQAAHDAWAATTTYEVRCCKEGSSPHETYSTQFTLDNVNNGTSTYPRTFMAASGTNGVADPDNGRYVITWDTATSILVNSPSNLADYISWHDIEFDFNAQSSHGSYTWSSANGNGNSNGTFLRCKLHNNKRLLFIRGPGQRMINCIIGPPNSALSGGMLRFDESGNMVIGCLFDGAGYGNQLVRCDGGSKFVNNVFMDGGGEGLHTLTGVGGVYTGNIFYNNASVGLLLGGLVGVSTGVVMNNIFAKNGTYGVDIENAFPGTEIFPDMDANLFWSNTSGAIEHNGTVITQAQVNDGPYGTNNVTGDPGFTSETAGSEDFTPSGSSSNLYSAGIAPRNADDTDNFTAMVGAMVPVAVAGGSGSAVARLMRIGS
jgi:hypothetical protein